MDEHPSGLDPAPPRKRLEVILRFDDFVFDRDGYLYATLVTPRDGGVDQRILLFDPQYHLMKDPFAQVGDRFADARFTDLAFAREAGGQMSTRLLVGRIVLSAAQNWIGDVVAFIGTLKPQPHSSALVTGDVARGRAAFAVRQRPPAE